MASLMDVDTVNDNDEDFLDDLDLNLLLSFNNENDQHEDIYIYEKQLRIEYNKCNNEKDYAVWVVKVVKQIEANPFPIIPMFQCVRDVCGKYKPNTITGHLARVTYSKMIDNIPTIKYFVKNVLGFDDLLYSDENDSTNFYDGGRGATLGTVKYMSGKTEPNKREVIVVDSKKRYCGLETHLQRVLAHLDGVESMKARIECVANYVCNAMGGPKVNIELSEKHIESLRSSTKFNTLVGEVLVGSIELGVCRHRSILFKWLCDHKDIGIPTRLMYKVLVKH